MNCFGNKRVLKIFKKLSTPLDKILAVCYNTVLGT